MRVPGAGLTGFIDGEGLLRCAEYIRQSGGDALLTRPRGKYLLELRAFDPNFCSCADFSGACERDWEFPMAPLDSALPALGTDRERRFRRIRGCSGRPL